MTIRYSIALSINTSLQPGQLKVLSFSSISKALPQSGHNIWDFSQSSNNCVQFAIDVFSSSALASNCLPHMAFSVKCNAGATASDSPSMYAVGAGNQVTGMRASLVIYDDIETAQTVPESQYLF